MGESGSCPIAETTGVVAAKTARTSPSSENGSRSSTEPPPRATTMTSTSGSRSSDLDRLDHLAGGVHALHRGVLHGEVHAGPAPPPVLQDVALGGGVLSRDQPDVARQERQRALALLGEQSLGREQLAPSLEAGQQLTLTDEADLAHGERERAPVGVERRLGVTDDLRALHQWRGQRVDHGAVAGDLDGDVGELVAQGQEDRVHAAAAADLGDLPLDPDGPEAVDPLADRLGDLAHGRRMLGRGLQGHVGTVVVRTYDW